MTTVEHHKQCICFEYTSTSNNLVLLTLAIGYVTNTHGSDTHRFFWTWDTGEDVGTDRRLIVTQEGVQTAFNLIRSAFEVPTAGTGYLLSAQNNTEDYLGQDWDLASAAFCGAETGITSRLCIEFGNTSETEMMPTSYCDGGIWYRYDDAGDDMYVVINVAPQAEYLIASNTITDQAAVKALLESIYPYGIWDYAWNLNTGNICVTWKGTGTTSFTFSQELSDIINLSDSASAFVVSRYPVNRERWLTESLNNSRIDRVVK